MAGQKCLGEGSKPQGGLGRPGEVRWSRVKQGEQEKSCDPGLDMGEQGKSVGHGKDNAEQGRQGATS